MTQLVIDQLPVVVGQVTLALAMILVIDYVDEMTTSWQTVVEVAATTVATLKLFGLE